MKLIIFTISIMLIFTGCAIKTGNNTDKSEPAEGVLPEIPNVQMSEMPEVKMAAIPGLPQVGNLSINQVVEAACGQCQLGMTGKAGCDLAVRLDGKSYFVDGTSIHDHGDAHADDGFCETIRKAEVNGKIVDGRFKADSFKLVD